MNDPFGSTPCPSVFDGQGVDEGDPKGVSVDRSTFEIADER